MNHQRAAEIQVALEGVRLPASRDDLIRYAEAQDPTLAAELRSLLPQRTYVALDEVGEALVPVQPRPLERAPQPRPESDLPPGGNDYVNPSPESGAVRDDAPADNPPQRLLEQQSKTLKKQQQRQAG